MLRALTPRGAAFDPEAEFIARAKVLETRRRAAQAEAAAAGTVGAAGMASPSGGCARQRSGLSQELLGPWEKGVGRGEVPVCVRGRPGRAETERGTGPRGAAAMSQPPL